MADDAVEREFPLFPLGIVALPHELVPLHIFEERYKAMIADCLEQGREFGIVWDDGGDERGVGCAVEVAEVLERLDDGRMNIVTRGTRPFRVVGERADAPYPIATVAFLDDAAEQPDARTSEAAREAYGTLVTRATDRVLDADELADMSAYAMAATVDFGPEAKQGLLDLRSENARLRLVGRLLRAALKRLELADRAEARARSNGKVRFTA